MALPPAESLHLTTYTADAAALATRRHAVEADAPSGRILRSALRWPEHEAAAPDLHRRLVQMDSAGMSPG